MNSERAQKYFPEIASILRARAINNDESPRYITGDAHNVFGKGSIVRMEGVVTDSEPPRGLIRIIMTPCTEYVITPEAITDRKGINDEKTALDAYTTALAVNRRLMQVPSLDQFEQAPFGEFA